MDVSQHLVLGIKACKGGRHHCLGLENPGTCKQPKCLDRGLKVGIAMKDCVTNDESSWERIPPPPRRHDYIKNSKKCFYVTAPGLLQDFPVEHPKIIPQMVFYVRAPVL